jgi:hypothetical protein
MNFQHYNYDSQPASQQTVIVVNQSPRVEEKNENVGIYTFFTGLIFTPLVPLIALLWVKKPMSRAIITRTSGFCGLLWSALFFFIFLLNSGKSSWKQVYGDDYYKDYNYPYMPTIDYYDYPGYNYTSSSNHTTYGAPSKMAATSSSAVAVSSMPYYAETEAEYSTRALAIGMFALGVFMLLLSGILISIGCVSIRKIQKIQLRPEPARGINVDVEELYRHPQLLQQNPHLLSLYLQHQSNQHQQVHPFPLQPPPYNGASNFQEITAPRSTRAQRLSLESLAVHLDIPKLFSLSLQEAMEADFKRLKDLIGITELEFMKLKRYRTSVQ